MSFLSDTQEFTAVRSPGVRHRNACAQSVVLFASMMLSILPKAAEFRHPPTQREEKFLGFLVISYRENRPLSPVTLRYYRICQQGLAAAANYGRGTGVGGRGRGVG